MFENFYSFFWDWVKPVVEFLFKATFVLLCLAVDMLEPEDVFDHLQAEIRTR